MQRRGFAVSLALLALAGCREPSEPTPIVAASLSAQGDESANVLTIDHQVPHVSTVPANAGALVHLFVRERVRGDVGEVGDEKSRQALLMIHGRSIPVLPGMELRHGDYDWALWLARSGGLDVFMLDFQGSGRSPRPAMDDPCNVPRLQQERLLIPNPLPATCPPSYPFTLNTAASDLDELDTAVDYIRNLRGLDKVHIVSWSGGSAQAGPYAARHPEKVASLLFFAPIFNAGIEPAFPPPPADPPSPLPRPGAPMTLRTRADFAAGWNTEVECVDQMEPGIQDIVWAAIMENDELGRTWGPPPAGAQGAPPEGVMRVRQVVQWGWNAEMAAKLTVPTLIIRGELDSGQGGRQHVAELYRLIKNDNKLRFTVACAGHFMNWETQRRVLHQVSKEWIKHGRVGGSGQGEFYVDAAGSVRPL